MDIQLTPVTKAGKRAFSQLINLYNFNYDFTNYLNDDIPEDGFFFGDADYYLDNDKVQNFFIRADGKIAGYVIIAEGGDRYLDNPNAHSIEEFFVTRKYRRKGVGTIAAVMSFEMYDGMWEVCKMKDNIVAQKFWITVIDKYTNGQSHICETEYDELIGLIFNNGDKKC